VKDQAPRAPETWVAEAVLGPGGGSDDGSGADSATAHIAEELDLAVDDEHGVDGVVSVWRYFKRGVELDLVDRDLRQVDLNRDDSPMQSRQETDGAAEVIVRSEHGWRLKAATSFANCGLLNHVYLRSRRPR
jgi:hypothetical protein